MNKKGQALVEFIIVIPILLLTILAIFDITNIYKTKMELESTMEEVVLDENIQLENNVTLDKVIKDGKITYSLKKEVDVTSPLLLTVINKDYEVVITRTIYEK